VLSVQYGKQEFVSDGKMMSTLLSSGDVERVLKHLALVVPEGEVAFRARLKHLQRLGIPLGANTGKGRRVPHNLDTLFQLVVSVELMQIGIPPAMVARTIEWNWAAIREALLLSSLPAELLKEAELPDGPLFLVQSPHALEALMTIGVPGPGKWHDDVQIVDEDHLAAAISAGDREQIGPGRAIVLNLRWLAREAVGQLTTIKPTFDLFGAWKNWRELSGKPFPREIHSIDDEASDVSP
jgi:hypothetical protein